MSQTLVFCNLIISKQTRLLYSLTTNLISFLHLNQPPSQRCQRKKELFWSLGESANYAFFFSPTELKFAHDNNSGTGYIGSFTALELLVAGYEVIVIDNLYNSSEESLNRIELICGKRPIFYKADVTDQEALDKIFKDHPDIDSVIHFAALKVCAPLARVAYSRSYIRDDSAP